MILSGFGYTRRQLERLQRGRDWDACGVLQLAFDNKEAERQGKLAAAFDSNLLHALERTEAEAVAGVALPAGGLFYPEGGWVHPPALCQQQLQHPGIRLVTHQEVLELRKVDQQWQAWAGDRLIASAPVVILAGAAEVRRFEPCAQLPLKRIRGRLPACPPPPAAGRCAPWCVRRATWRRRAVMNIPWAQALISTAKTWRRRWPSTKATLALLDEISVDLAQRLGTAELAPEQLQGRAAFRCTSPDYLPIVGPVADVQAFAEAYAVLGRDARQVPDVACPWPGWVICEHAGMGRAG